MKDLSAFLLGKMREHPNSDAAIKTIGDLPTPSATRDRGRHPSRGHVMSQRGNGWLNDEMSLSGLRDEF
jgi:hypothetical protein